jgi:hypothetical protein
MTRKRKETEAAYKQRLSEMTDAEFAQHLKDAYEIDFDAKPTGKQIPRYTGTDDVVAKIDKGENVKSHDLLRQMAIEELAIRSGFDYHTPWKIRDLIASRLARGVIWQRDQQSKADPKHRHWRQQAETLRKEHPKHSYTRIAELIKANATAATRGSVRQIRKIIAKKK